jgi:hypothetical protein
MDEVWRCRRDYSRFALLRAGLRRMEGALLCLYGTAKAVP